MTLAKRLLRSVYFLAVSLFSVALLAACDLVEPKPYPKTTVIFDPGAEPRKATVPPQGRYRLRAGDTISVFVFDNPDISTTVVVAPDGRASYPLAGSFQAEGRTLDQIRNLLATRFADNIVAPQVSVSLASVRAYTVFVNGEVLQPGAFDLQEPITLVQAIARAGGFTAFAKRDRILIYNPTSADGARRVFDYDKFVADPWQQDLLLKPGDTVIVQ